MIKPCSCEKLKMIDTEGNFVGCPYFTKDHEFGAMCDAIEYAKMKLSVYDTMIGSTKFPGCKFGVRVM